MQLTLLSRAWCHLCDEMQAAAAPLAASHGAALVVIDVDDDDDPALALAHGDRVPVLFLGTPGSGVELCHFHIDLPGVRAALAAAAGPRAADPEIC